MNFVKKFDFFGVEAQQIPCITGSGAPTAATAGAVGCLYMDVDTGEVYKCTAAAAGGYTWQRAEGSANETDPKFFAIDYYGVVSLKPEYRGHHGTTSYPYSVSDNGVGVDGSKINELPEVIVIPEVINKTAVAGLAVGMFQDNHRVKEIVLPKTVGHIPEKFCKYAISLRSIKNTEHITSIGNGAFHNSGIAKAIFPNLTEMGIQAFCQCVLMYFADIGDKIASLPSVAFGNCRSLSVVKGGKSVTSVGEHAFYTTVNLTVAPFIANLKSIGNYAFMNSRIRFDWNTLTGCTFGTNATPVIDNTADYWSGCNFTPCENPLNTLLHQQNPAWASTVWGSTSVKWSVGCVPMSVLHIHSALSGKTYTNPQEFEDEVYSIDASLLSESPKNHTHAVKMLTALGYKATRYTDAITSATYQTVLDKLNAGAYVLSNQGVLTDANTGHAVILYGVNEYGEVLVADSDVQHHYIGIYDEGLTYSVPYQNMTGPDTDIIIVERA